jgi:uncharacterized protein
MNCPICKKPVPQPQKGQPPAAHFPFCSDRCKLIDLGRWLDGKYQVPVRPNPDDDSPPAPT